MADILDEAFTQGVEPGAVDLSDFVSIEGSGLQLPRSASRNKAATTALLSDDPSKAVDNFQLMMQEGAQGQDSLSKQLSKTIEDRTLKADMTGVMSILSDPNISLEQKKAVVKSVRDSMVLKDRSTILMTNNLMAHSRGEDVEHEDARLSSADSIREIYESRLRVQGLVNAHAASLDSSSTIKTIAEMTETWVMPFGNSIAVAKLKKELAKQEGKPLSLWGIIKAFAQPGTATAEIREKLEKLPPAERVKFAKSIIETLSKNSGIVFGSDNQFNQFDKASSIFEEGGYSGFQEFMDNVSPLLDVIGLGFAARGAKKAANAPTPKDTRIDPIMDGTSAPVGPTLSTSRELSTERVIPGNFELVDDRPKFRKLGEEKPKLEGIADEVLRIEYNYPVRQENPASPASIIQQSNPEKARTIHATVVKSNTDEVAEGLYGVSKEQAIVNDVFPQAATESGAVVSKVADIQRDLRKEMHVPDELIDMVHNTGAIYYTKAEKAAARANIVNKFRNAEGLTVNDAMSSFTLEGGRVKVSAVYGLDEGSFLKPEDALSQAKLALRNYGILDSEITLFQKQGLDHVPVKLEDVKGQEGNFLVRVDSFSDFDFNDIGKLETFDVKRNLFDRISTFVSNQKGSVSRWMFDAASMLHPIYTGAASATSDATAKFDKFLLKIASEYSDQFSKFNSTRKAKIDDYIREANYNGVWFNQADLIARGFSTEEISALRSWRDFWDAHFYLENYDVVRTLNAQGYQLFKNATTELYAKPIPKNQNLGKIYDPATNNVVIHTKADGDALYNAGGTYAKLRRPTDIAGVTVEHMLVRNTPNEYLRRFRDTDQVLNYRPGYFQIQYTAPKFVDEITKDAQGNITKQRAVAVAGDTAEAEHFKNRMAGNAPQGTEYKVRGDDRAMTRGDDAWWDVNSASGRIAQRVRGKLLEDASGLNHLGDGSYILNPVDSAVRAAKSIAGRTVSRPMLEAAKARFLNQYGHLAPSNGMGGRRWPSKVSEIGEKGNFTTKELADARTTYEYINYLENGYINTVDEAFKAFMNMTADMLGSAGMSKAERGAQAVGRSAPTSLAKNSVFQAYIGTNLLRQLIVQPHQIVRTFAYNPIGWANGSIAKYAAEFTGNLMGLGGRTDFVKFVEDSGLMQAVDKSNLVRGTLTDAADSTNKVIRMGGKALNVPRKLGFDIGEQANLLGHAAAVYERFKRLGRNLSDKHVRDEAYSEIRAISYDMNFAGDMPYNQTTPSVLLQFMQVPHKAFLQMTNRRIPWDVRLRLVGGDILMWGPPTILVSELLGGDILPDDPKLKEFFIWGAESMLLNNMFSEFAGERVNLDLSSLAPYDMTGWGKFFEAMLTGGGVELITNSPAGQLFLKDGGRARNAIASMSRYFNVIEDYDESPETFLSVMNEVMKLSSGWNNATKAKLLLDARQRYDQYGNAIDNQVSHVEAWAQAFGFGTADTRDLYRTFKKASEDVKAHKEETLKVYNDIKRYYAEKLELEATDPQFMTKVTGRIMKVFEDDPVAKQIILQQLKNDLAGKDQALLGVMMRRSGIPNPTEIKDTVRQMPIDDEQKQMMLDRIEAIRKLRNQPKEE